MTGRKRRMGPASEVVHVRMHPRMLARVAAVCDALGIRRPDAIRYAVQEWLESAEDGIAHRRRAEEGDDR